MVSVTRGLPRTLVVMAHDAWELQFDDRRRARLAQLSRDGQVTWTGSLDDPAVADRLAEVEVLLTGWGTPLIGDDELSRLPSLRAVLHCAGTVRGIVAPAVWGRGVLVSSSADLNADPVAEFTIAAMVMAGKKAPFLAADARRYREDWSYKTRRGPLSNTGRTVGIVGFSRIGRRVVRLAVDRLPDVTCLVVDPYADPAEVARAGAQLIGLAEALPRLDFLSIHAPELPETHHLIGAPQLAALPDGATLINTARGSLVDTAALEAECVAGRLHAILDVTDPEPLPASSPLYDLPNVMLTPHVAGSLGSETLAMTDGALDELERLVDGRPLARPVHVEDLARIA